MNKTRIVLFTMAAAVTYGVIHDEITAHLCVEYFSVAHPPLFHTQSPTILALCWGIAATIGIGAMLGLILAEVSQSEGPPPLQPVPFSRITRSLLILLAAMAAGALISGYTGYLLATKHLLSLPASIAEEISPSRQARFMAVWFAHMTSYAVGIGGGTALILSIWRQRGKPRVIQLIPHTWAGAARVTIVLAVAAAIIWLRIIRSGN